MSKKKPGCFSGCLSLVLIVIILTVIVFVVAYKRMGEEEIKVSLLIRSLDNMKKRVLEIENLDVTPEEIESRMEKVKSELAQGKGNPARVRHAIDKLEKQMRATLKSSQLREFLREITEAAGLEIDNDAM